MKHVFLLILLPGSGLWAPLSAAERPNIILVITDDQGYGPVGKHGHPWIKTPNLDTLYDKSVRFTRASSCGCTSLSLAGV